MGNTPRSRHNALCVFSRCEGFSLATELLEKSNTANSTLQNTIESASETSKEISETASDLNSKLQNSITQANTLKQNLDASTDKAETTETELESATEAAKLVTTNANAAKTELDKSISSGSTIKTNLDSSISLATKAKTDLDASVVEANSVKASLDESNQTASDNITQLQSHGAYTKDESDLRFANAIKPTESGTLVHLEDSAEAKVPVLKIYGNSTQDGTPTPDNPIDIVSVGDGGSVEVSSVPSQKNLFNLLKIANGSEYVAADGVIIALNSNGAASNRVPVFTSGTSYTASVVSNGTIQLHYVMENGKTDYWTLSTPITSSRYGRTFNATSPIVEAWIVSTSALNEFTISDFQLELGSTATDYEPYVSTDLTVSGIEPLRGIGDYRDCLTVYADGSGEIERNVESLNSVDTVVNEYVDNYGTYLTLPKYGRNSNMVYSSHFSTSQLLLANHARDEYTSVRVLKNALPDTITSFETATTWFSTNSVNFSYILTTPTTETLTSDQVSGYLMTHYGISNIYNTEGADIEVTYIADPKLYVDNKISELSSAIASL